MTDTTSQTIQLDGKHKQLVDLNKSYTTFEAEFTLQPHTLDLGKSYEIAVVSQTLLDGDGEISYKKIDGIYSGSIKNEDANGYQNYFLVVKSAEPFKENVTVEVLIKSLDNFLMPPQGQVHNQGHNQSQSHNQGQSQSHNQEVITHEKPVNLPPTGKVVETPKSNKWGFKIKLFIAFFVLVCGVFLLYYFYKRSKKTKSKLSLKEYNQTINANEVKPEIKLEVSPPVPTPTPTPTQPPVVSEKQSVQLNFPTPSKKSSLAEAFKTKMVENKSPVTKSQVFKPTNISPVKKNKQVVRSSSSSSSSNTSTSGSLSSSSSSSSSRPKHNLKGKRFVFDDDSD
jgi:hypothetical protein